MARDARRAPERVEPVATDVKVLTPFLASKGLSWRDLAAFIDFRNALFEVDTRFSSVGESGIFESLDRSGVLSHRVVSAREIEAARTEPPSTGRARIRSQWIKKLQAAREHYRCDWSGIWDQQNNRYLDLANPFVERADWRSLAEQEVHEAATQSFMERFTQALQGNRRR